MSASRKKCLAASIVALCAFIIIAPNARASEEAEGFDARERASEAIEGFYDELPQSAQDYIDESGESSINPLDGLSSLLKSLADELEGYLKQPLRILGVSVAAAALCAAVSAACAGTQAEATVRLCCAAFAATAACSELANLALDAAEAAERSAGFTAVFAPIFAGLLISAGEAGSGAFYVSAVIAAQSVFANLITSLVKPLVGVMLGISVVSSLASGGLSSLLEGVKKLAVWLITGASALFCGVVRLQTSVTASADGFALRAARFALGGAVPVIGRSVAEALATVSGGLAVIRSTVGSMGVVAIAGIFAPIALRCILCSLALSLSAILCDALEVSGPARALRGMKAGVDILCAVVVFNALCIIIATATLMKLGGTA